MERTINCILEATSNLVDRKQVLFNGRFIELKELGLSLVQRDIGTGYHIKEGIFISNKEIDPTFLSAKDAKIDICKIPSIVESIFIQH